jgi:RNA 2',3'-cyclic 3'-phosphodiesterase
LDWQRNSSLPVRIDVKLKQITPMSNGNWFVGLPVNTASGWLQKCLSKPPHAFRAFTPEDIHLTVAFFGRVSADKPPLIIEAMKQLNAIPFSITLGSLRALPSPKRISAISFELSQGQDNAAELIASWRTKLFVASGSSSDTRLPLPHITIGRPKRQATRQELRDILDWAEQIAPPTDEILIDRAALYTWSDDRKVRQFNIVYEQILAH